MRVLWLAAARGGSKGVPGKNLREIQGLSLLGWKLRAAFAAGADRVVLSTDSAEIAAEGVRHGATALMRPAELATDTATSASVVMHALTTLATAGERYDAVMLLEPSTPFTPAWMLRKGIEMMRERDADLVCGMKVVEPSRVFVGDVREDASITPIAIAIQRMADARRRQDVPVSWTPAGTMYLFKAGMFLETGDIYGGVRNYGVLADKYHSIEIDTPEDMEYAEFVAAKGYVKPEGV